tara:strand:+ start:803 stop:2020 length:1218 start_codon:yes stop_codon:yes gene_type:complete
MAFKRSNFHIHNWQQRGIADSSRKGLNVLKRNSKMIRGSDALANRGQVIHFHRPNSIVDPGYNNSSTNGMPAEEIAALMGESPDVFFKAFITAYNESFGSEWAEETVIGRADGLHMFKSTSRSISLGFQAPAASESEAFSNLLSLQALIRMLYPAYTDGENALSISQSPLVRVKIMNILMDSSGRSESKNDILLGGNGQYRGVLAAVKNISVSYNLENDVGVIEVTENSLNEMLINGGGPRVKGDGEIRTGAKTGGTKKILPKLLDISMELDIIHESFLGWTHSGIYDEEGDETYGPIFSKDPPGDQDGPTDKRLDMEFSLPYDPNRTTKHNSNFPYGLGDAPEFDEPPATPPGPTAATDVLPTSDPLAESAASAESLETADEASSANAQASLGYWGLNPQGSYS